MGSPTITMFAPDGSPGEIPADKVQAAQQAGFKRAYSMTSPDGKAGVIPEDRVADAEKAGFKKGPAPYDASSDHYRDRYDVSAGGIAQGALNEAGNVIKGGASMFAAPQGIGEALLGPALPAYRMVKGYGQSAVAGLKQAASYAQNGQPVRAAATVVGAVNPLSSGPTASINQRVDQGAPISNVIGQGLTDAGLLAAPEVARVAAPVVSRAAQGTAEGLYRNALKPSTTAPAATNAARVRTGLDEGLPVSAAGYEKLGNLIDDYNQKIAGEIAKDPNRPISPASSLNNLRSVRDKFQNQVTPGADVDAVNAKGNEFAGQFQPGGRFPQGTLPAADAQAMKQGTYSVLRGKFGEQGSAAVESEKALARGLKEEIANQFPEIANLNKAESRLLDLGPILERAVNRVSNNHTIGIGGPIMRDGSQGGDGEHWSSSGCRGAQVDC
jgi:hypothetical protein